MQRIKSKQKQKCHQKVVKCSKTEEFLRESSVIQDETSFNIIKMNWLIVFLLNLVLILILILTIEAKRKLISRTFQKSQIF